MSGVIDPNGKRGREGESRGRGERQKILEFQFLREGAGGKGIVESAQFVLERREAR